MSIPKGQVKKMDRITREKLTLSCLLKICQVPRPKVIAPGRKSNHLDHPDPLSLPVTQPKWLKLNHQSLTSQENTRQLATIPWSWEVVEEGSELDDVSGTEEAAAAEVENEGGGTRRFGNLWYKTPALRSRVRVFEREAIFALTFDGGLTSELRAGFSLLPPHRLSEWVDRPVRSCDKLNSWPQTT